MKSKLFLHIAIGFAFGILILQPLVISLHMYDMQGDQGNWWIWLLTSYQQVVGSWDVDQVITKLLFGLLGVTLALLFMVRQKIFQLTGKRDRLEEIKELIAAGENQQTEFKSSLRWDLRFSQPNKALGDVVAKAITGFMNTQGGHLFIGIDDDGQLRGLQEDYATLKKPGRDGFEQYIMELISNKLGTNFCTLVTVSFYKMEAHDVCHLSIKKSRSPVYLHKDETVHIFTYVQGMAPGNWIFQKRWNISKYI